MASFLENLTQFTPYMPQQPVEAMVNIGMQKQQQYDEGVQKIQDQFTLIAGLPIAKDPVKQHLQQKLNEVKEKVSGGIATDFSNQRLVNNVMSLTKQIASDPIIELGVRNTLALQQNDEQEEKDAAEGKPNMANSYIYRQDRNAWLNDGQVDSPFSAKYHKYIDVTAKLREAAKAVGEDERIVEQIFKTDGQGRVMVGPDGKPMISDYMAEQHFKGKDFKKLYNYFVTSLTPDDYNQLGITGRYVNKDRTPEDLVADATEQYQSVNKEYFDRGLTANIKLSGLLAKSKPTPEEKEMIQSLKAEISDYELKLAENEKSHQNLLQRIGKNPEGVKASMYTNNFLLNTARSLAGTSEYTLFKDNPVFKAWVDRQQLNQGWQRLALEEKKYKSDQEWKQKNYDWDVQKFYLENPNLSPNFNEGRPGTLETPSDFLSIKENEVETNYGEMVGASQQIAIAALKSYSAANGKNITDAQAMDAIKNWSVKLKQPIEEITMRFATRYLEELKRDKKSIDKPYIGAVDVFNESMNRWQASSVTMQKATEYAKDRARLNNEPVADEKELLNKMPTTKLKLMNGQTITLSKQDMMDFAYADSDILSSDFIKDRRDAAVKRLQSKYPGIANRNQYIIPFSEPSALQALQTAKSLIYSDKFKNLRKYQEEFFATKGITPINKEFDLFIGKEKEADFNARLTNTLSKYSGINSDVEAIIENIQSGKGSSSAKVVVVPSFTSGGENKYQLAITSGGKTQNVDISEDDAKYFTGKPEFQRYITSPEVDLLRYSNNGSTNASDPSSPSAWKTSAFKENKFPRVNLKDYTLNADFVKDGANPNSGWLKLYLVPNNGGDVKTVTMGAVINGKERPMSYDELALSFNYLTTDDILKEIQ